MRKTPSARALAAAAVLGMFAAGCGSERELSDREIGKIADRVYERLYPKVNQMIREQMAYRGTQPTATATPTSPIPMMPTKGPTTKPDSSPVLVEIEGGRRFTLDDAKRFLAASARPGENLNTAFGRIVQVLLFAHAAGREKMHANPAIRREIEVRTKDALTHYLIKGRDRLQKPISLDDVRNFYERSKNTFFTRPSGIKVRQFQTRSIAEAQAFIDKVRAGASFEALATGKPPVIKGSVLGKPIDLVPGQVPARLFSTLEALEEGQMTAPLRIGATGACCVYQIVKKQKAATLPYARVKRQIHRMLLTRRRKAIEDKLDAEARQRYKVVVFEDRIDKTDSLTVLGTVEGDPILRNDLLLELKRLPEKQRLRFGGKDGFQRLFVRYLRRELFARLALVLPETAPLHALGNEMRDLVLASHFTRKALGRQIRVAASEVGNYYNANRKLYRIRGADVCVRMRQIRFDVTDEASRAKAVEAAQGAIDQIKGGASFKTLATKLSQDKATAPLGGDTGFVRMSKLPKGMGKHLRHLEPGQIVQTPITTKDAVFAVQLLAYSPYRPLKEVLENIKRALALKKQEETIAVLAGKLRKQYNLKTYPERLPPPPKKKSAPTPVLRPAPGKGKTGLKLGTAARKGLRIIPVKRPKTESKPPVIQWKPGAAKKAVGTAGKGS